MRRGPFTAVVIVVAALVIASGILLVSYLPELVPEDAGRKMLSQWIEENTNAEMKAGYIAPLFLPGIGVQVRDLDVRLKQEDGAKEFFCARSIKSTSQASRYILIMEVGSVLDATKVGISLIW